MKRTEIRILTVLLTMRLMLPNVVLAGPPDFDGDNDVDLADVIAFQSCFAGPDVSLPPACADRDLDGDGDADLADFVALQSAFTGSLAPQDQPTIVDSNVEVRLGRLIYSAADLIDASVHVSKGGLSGDIVPLVVATAESGDVEVLTTRRADRSDVYTTDEPLPIEPFEAGGVVPHDGVVSLGPNEMFFAIYYPDRTKEDLTVIGEAKQIVDFALLEDLAHQDPNVALAPSQIVPELAMSDDEIDVPPGGKQIGTLTVDNGLPVQVPVDELVIFPTSDEQLERFLESTQGKVVMSDVLVDEPDDVQSESYLVRVKTESADLDHLPQMRALLGEKHTLYASNEEVLRIVALAMQLRLEGFLVGVNPRLHYMGAPDYRDSVRESFTDSMFDIERLWAYTALWDADAADGKTIPVAFLDTGFAPNPDFRGFPNFVECDMEGASLVGGMRTGFACGPGTAVGPPLVGNSFFGNRSWHGNGMVTTAAVREPWSHRHRVGIQYFEPRADCNGNGTPDFDELAAGTVADVSPANGVPDTCDARDCNSNGMPDGSEIASGASPDCNDNGRPDDCDVTAAPIDRDVDGIPDICQAGSGGTGGQVVVPMLYRFGLSSYAFEIGLGISRAVMDGATLINISAGYPCRVIDNIGINFNICSPGGRAALCGFVTSALVTAHVAICATATATAAIPIVGPILAGPLLAACAESTAATVLAIAGCQALIISVRDNLRDTMTRGVGSALAAGVTVISNAGNRLSPDTLPPVLRDFVNLDNIDAGAWGIVPCTIPGVICVGAVEPCLLAADSDGDGDVDRDDCPMEQACCSTGPLGEGCCYPNAHFAGAVVDLWAPIANRTYAPPNVDTVVPPPGHIRHDSGGGTSAAAAYVTGVAAMMQAINPQLDPRTPSLSAAQRLGIPAQILSTLRDTAFPDPVVDALAIAAGSRADPSGLRRNLIDPMTAVQFAARGPIAGFDVPARGYDRALNFNEILGVTDDDSRSAARPLGSGLPLPILHSGTILDIDEDWYEFTASSAPGLYQVTISLTTPREFGDLILTEEFLRLHDNDAPTPAHDADERVAEYRTLPLFPDTPATFAVRRPIGRNDDNVYKLIRSPDVRVGDLPAADRFDRNDPAVNPPESRPDNNVMGRAVHLGGTDELDWMLVSGTLRGDVYQLSIPGMNFHSSDDVDWFSIERLPDFTVFEGGGCQPRLEVSFGDGVALRVVAADGSTLLETTSSPAEIPVAFLSPPIHFELRPIVPGVFVDYELTFEFHVPSTRICNLASIGLQVKEFAAARSFIRYPEFFPDLKEIPIQGGPMINGEPDPYTSTPRRCDPAGRITTPESYLISWPGGRPFELLAELRQGTSIAVQLMDTKGTIINLATTPDIAGLFEAPVPASTLEDPRTVVLQAGQLPVGDYLVSFSHGQLETRLEMSIPGLLQIP